MEDELKSDKVHMFEFNCWYLSDGDPHKRWVYAVDKDTAIEIFKDYHPDMGYDDPYIYQE